MTAVRIGGGIAAAWCLIALLMASPQGQVRDDQGECTVGWVFPDDGESCRSSGRMRGYIEIGSDPIRPSES